MRFFTLLLTASCLLCFAPRADAQERATDEHGVTTQLFDHPGAGVRGGEAWGEVDAPLTEVLAVVYDYANYSEFLPHFQTSRVLAQRGHRARVYMEVSILRGSATLWGQLMINSREAGGAHVIEARLTEGNMDHFVARWELRPLDGGSRTQVKFRILVEPDLPVPALLVGVENYKSARRTIRVLRERILAIRP